MRATPSLMLQTTATRILFAFAFIGVAQALAADVPPSALNSRDTVKTTTPFNPYGVDQRAHPATSPAPPVDANAPNSRNARVVPKDLFKMDDRATITVGNKQVPAGDVKREFKATIAKLAGPPSTYRVPARKNLAAAPVANAAVAKGAPEAVPVRGGIPSPFTPFRNNAKVSTTTLNDGAAAQWNEAASAMTVHNGPNTPYTSIDKPGASTAGPNDNPYASIVNYCKTKKPPPEIQRIRGTVASGQKFTIEGTCLGDQTGAVELIGQFPQGNLRVAFDKWSEDAIEVVMPAVRGAADHAVAITVVRASDKARSAAKQATFHAARERVEVPVYGWTPSPDFIYIGVDEGGGNIFGGYKVFGSGTGSYTADFRVAVAAACYLDDMAADSQTGRIQAINGWDNGPPNVSNVQIVWSPVCTTTTTNYVFASSSQRVCSVGFNLKAWADCPVGIAP